MKKINLTTPINQLGFGIVGLNTMLALQRLGIEVALWSIGPITCPTEHQARIDRAVAATREYSPLAPSIRVSHAFDLAHHVGRGVRAAITFVERDRLTATEIHNLQNQDVVVASSSWMKELFARQIVGPKIIVASPGIDRDVFSPSRPQISIDTAQDVESDSMSATSALTFAKPPAGPTTFIAIGKWEVRKGHDLLPTLFERAFTPRDNFKLILMTVNPFLTQAQHNAWCQSFAKLAGKVELHHSRLPDQRALAAVLSQVDCGVFLSRAEGWNLDAAEMLAMGKHVIITNYSAHSEFVNRDNAWLVEIDELESARDGLWFDGFGQWAKLGQRQQAQAIAHLRAVHQLKQAGRLGPNVAGQQSMQRFTWRTFAETLVQATEQASKR